MKQSDDPAFARSLSALQLRRETFECSTHGPVQVTTWGDREPACHRCVDEARASQDAEREEAERAQRIQDRMARSGLRGRFLDATFSSYETPSPGQQKAHAVCRRFVEGLPSGTGVGLLLIGSPGTGKTHLGAAMVQAAIAQRDQTARWIGVRDLIRDLRSTWASDSRRSEESVIDDYGRLGLLVLDEIGVDFGSPSELTQLLDVVDRRYQLKRPTVVISNHTVPELQGILGDRIYDRIRSGAKVVVCDWASRR